MADTTSNRPSDRPEPIADRSETPGRHPVLFGALIAAVLAVGAAACGGDSGGSAGGSGGETGGDGRQIAIANGCASCHGSDGQGGVGPTWIGLAGTTVELEDGTTVVADTDYLTRAIVDPAVEIRPGWSVKMPQRTFQPGEVEAMVEYIESLG